MGNTQRPKFFEVSVGTKIKPSDTEHCDPMLSREEEVVVSGVRLKGRIDRIDHDDAKSLAIVDYKTGKAVAVRQINLGTSLQLPLYIRVAEDLLSSQFPEMRGVAALYHRVMHADSPRELGLAVKTEMEKAFEAIKGRAGLLKN